MPWRPRKPVLTYNTGRPLPMGMAVNNGSRESFLTFDTSSVFEEWMKQLNSNVYTN